MASKIKEFAWEWLDTALDDLRWAKASFKDGFYSRVCFISQQVAEKSLKGFLYYHKDRIKSHDLVRLRKECQKHDSDFSVIDKATTKLNRYYLKTRYPDTGDFKEFENKELSSEAIEMAEEVLNFVKNKLK